MVETPVSDKVSCPTCGGELIQKSKVRLIVVGICMMDSLIVAFFVPLFWIPGVILALIGTYLLIWGTLGKGRWCRNCKKFSVSR